MRAISRALRGKWLEHENREAHMPGLFFGLERVFGLPPSLPFSLAAFALAFDLTEPPSFPSWRAILLTSIFAA